MAKQAKTVFIPARFTPSDAAAIRKAAEQEGITVSEYIRSATLAYMALRFNKHALNAVLTGAREMMREFEEEAKGQFFAKKVRA